MSETADRYRNVAARFTETVQQADPTRWDAPSPCEGWTARDVIRHMIETSGFFLGRAGVQVQPGPSVDDDPLAAWLAVRDAVQAALDDPAVAGIEFDGFQGRTTLEETVGLFGIGDVLVHTWDVARATGVADTLDADECERLLAAIGPNDELMRQGGAFGPKVDVPADADVQTRLLAFTGRRP